MLKNSVITKISSFFNLYIKHESTAGITLLVMTIIALIISNSFLSEDYFKALKTYYALGFGEFKLKKEMVSLFICSLNKFKI